MADNPKSIEKSLVAPKDWKYAGETRASARPKNALLDIDIDFDTTLLNIPLTNEQNSEIFKHVLQRFKEKTFDNYEFTSACHIAEVSLPDIQKCETNKEILSLYENIENELRKITDWGNDGF
ncbi:hypothetical protein PAEPH01_1002 [Pancytospora epiphaga]|nr:hypothetical protein PAEPH01_1002 [Pancytospora epiphaga]